MFFILASKELSSVDLERSDLAPGFEVILHSNDLETALGYIYMQVREAVPAFYENRFVRVMDDKGFEHYLFMRYDWEPEDKWVQINPHPSKLTGFVVSPGEHLRPNSKKLVDAYIKENNLEV